MPDQRQHRGRHPADEALFAPAQRPILRQAVDDLSWLLGRGYSEVAAIALVGDRHGLRKRQRLAVRRCACADADRQRRQARQVAGAALRGREVAIDGFNCVVTLESAMGGGLVLVGRDGGHRDLASVHGSYRRVAETRAAVEAVADLLRAAEPAAVTWYLDRPVSNSGRLAGIIREVGAAAGCSWPWEVALVFNPDREMVTGNRVAASCDAWVLDRAEAWIDLPGEVIRAGLPHAWVVDLGAPAG